MSVHLRDPSPRAIGAVYLSYFLAGITGALFLKGIVVSGDAAATAKNILVHEALYRANFAFDLTANVLYVALAACFFVFFRQVNRTAAMLAALACVAGCTVQITGELFRMAPLVILKSTTLAAHFSSEQLRAAALFSLTMHAEAIRIAIVCFAAFDLMIGYLIIKSGFVPRVIGALMVAGGTGALTLLWPPLAVKLQYVIVPVGGVAELALMLWLLLKAKPPA